ncbi:MAG: hypothetical protein QXR30_04840 [Candidatus Woesearchaeota archaeon]
MQNNSKKKVRLIVVDPKIREAIKEFYSTESEILFLLKGYFDNGIAYVHDIFYVKQYSNSVSVFFHEPFEKYIGTLHTHPINSEPSKQDFFTFNKLGGIHILYDGDEFKGYDKDGNYIDVVFREVKKKKQKPMPFYKVLIIFFYICIILFLIFGFIFLIR